MKMRVCAWMLCVMTGILSAQEPAGSLVSDARGASVLRVGMTYLGRPYAAGMLEQTEEERLLVRTDSVDCIIFVENVLAEAMGGSFEDNLRKIRYRNGLIDGYASRLHYIADWVDNGVRNGFLADVTALYCPQIDTLSIFYMSAHADRYKHLAHSSANVERIRMCEQSLTGKSVHVLHKENLPDKGLDWIHSGDIIALTTDVPGLDVAHVGIACYKKGKLHLLHASSVSLKVEISEEPLSGLLKKHRKWTGIRVVRLLP